MMLNDAEWWLLIKQEPHDRSVLFQHNINFFLLFLVREAFENMKKSIDQEIADLKSQLNGISKL